jgi:hypothetical protein
LTKAYKGLGADSEEKREPASDVDTALVDSLKALDPNRPIREADIASKLVRAAKNVSVPRPRGSVINDAPRPQCDIRTGTVIVFRIARVAPPRTNSRRREWP